MKDFVEIRDLRVRAFVGINDWEKEERQDILVSIRLYCDTRKAARSDDIADAVNYRDVAKRVLELAEGKRFNLVERLADEIAGTCCRDFGVKFRIVNIDHIHSVFKI